MGGVDRKPGAFWQFVDRKDDPVGSTSCPGAKLQWDPGPGKELQCIAVQKRLFCSNRFSFSRDTNPDLGFIRQISIFRQVKRQRQSNEPIFN